MPKVGPHHHKCDYCGVKVECGGTWEQNFDGEPEVTCPEYHLGGGGYAEIVCDTCEGLTEAEREAILETRVAS